ncbi:MAG: glycosyltransferase [Myxococcota bacterium]
MRILSLIDCLLTGGGQHIMFNIIRGLPEYRHKVAYLYPTETDGAMKQMLADYGLPVELVDPSIENYWPQYAQADDERLAKALTRVINEFKPHVVLRHFWAGRETAGRKLPLPRPRFLRPVPKYVCIIHDFYPAPEGYDFYVPTSKDNDVSYQTHIPPSQKKVIYNGVDVAAFDNPKTPHKGFIIGRAATLFEKKIPADFIDFAAAFDIPNVKFVFAGEGGRRAEFEKRAAELGISDKFEFLGAVDYYNIPQVLSRFDISCYLTDTHVETFSMAMIEKAVAGVVVVAEPRGSLPEQIIHGKTGFLSNDRREIKRYCELLFKEPSLLAEMSEAARKFGRQFTIFRQAEQYREIIQKLCG